VLKTGAWWRNAGEQLLSHLLKLSGPSVLVFGQNELGHKCLVQPNAVTSGSGAMKHQETLKPLLAVRLTILLP
jgi:hypothetical protein